MGVLPRPVTVTLLLRKMGVHLLTRVLVQSWETTVSSGEAQVLASPAGLSAARRVRSAIIFKNVYIRDFSSLRGCLKVKSLNHCIYRKGFFSPLLIKGT